MITSHQLFTRAAVCVAVVSAVSCAQAACKHCDIKNWGPISTTATTPALPADYRSEGNYSDSDEFVFDAKLNGPPPPSARPNCSYEVSDITQVGITFIFDGTMTWESLEVGPLETTHYNPPFSFISGTTWTFQIDPHPDPFSAYVTIPDPHFPVRLSGDNNGFKITAATISLSGHHYYTAVPEPSTLILAVVGLSALMNELWPAKKTLGRVSVESKRGQ